MAHPFRRGQLVMFRDLALWPHRHLAPVGVVPRTPRRLARVPVRLAGRTHAEMWPVEAWVLLEKETVTHFRKLRILTAQDCLP